MHRSDLISHGPSLASLDALVLRWKLKTYVSADLSSVSHLTQLKVLEILAGGHPDLFNDLRLCLCKRISDSTTEPTGSFLREWSLI